MISRISAKGGKTAAAQREPEARCHGQTVRPPPPTAQPGGRPSRCHNTRRARARQQCVWRLVAGTPFPPRPMIGEKRESSSGGPWRRRRSGARSPAALQRLAAGGITAHLAAILKFSAATRLPRGDVDCQKLCERSKADERVTPLWTRSLGCVTVRVQRHWPGAHARVSPHVTRRQCCAVSAALRGCGPVTEARSSSTKFSAYLFTA